MSLDFGPELKQFFDRKQSFEKPSNSMGIILLGNSGSPMLYLAGCASLNKAM